MHDICLLTETWTNERSNLELPGYVSYCFHRKRHKKAKRDSGGLAVFIKLAISKGVSVIKNREDNVVWLKLDKTFFSLENDVLLSLCYVVPSVSSRQRDLDTDIFDDLVNDMAHFKNMYSESGVDFILCGDLNARTGSRQDFLSDDTEDDAKYLPLYDDYVVDSCPVRMSKDLKSPNENGLKLLDMCKMSGLRMLNGRCGNDANVGEFTCHTVNGSSVVDYVCVSSSLLEKCHNFDIFDNVQQVSDHNMLSFNLNAKYDESTKTDKKVNKLVWNPSEKESWVLNLSSVSDKLSDLVEGIDISTDYNETENVDHVISEYTKVLRDVAEPLFKKTYTLKNCNNNESKQPPYYTDECKDKKIIFLEALNKFRKTRNVVDKLAMINARKGFKREVRKSRRIFNREKTENLLKARYKNAKLYWKLLKGRSSNNVPQISNYSLFSHFKNLSVPTEDSLRVSEDVEEYLKEYERDIVEMQNMYSELDNLISPEEVIRACKQLKSGKASGCDMLINELFINGRDVLVSSLTTLFNKLLSLGYFPSSWSEGILVAIHKSGDKNSAENYRGITLLSVFGKLFTKVINNRLNTWADNYSIIIEAQAGFRQHYSTVDNIFIMHGLISHFTSMHKQLYCAFVDFRKAFDLINHKILWYKLIKSGVTGKVLKLIRSMYSCIKTKVMGFDGTLSDNFEAFVGVRQGECLSPFLFSMYVNDMEQALKTNGVKGVCVNNLKLFLLLYADDTVIFGESAESLQNALNSFETYCDKWNLTVNTNKTKVMVFRKGGRLKELPKFMFKNRELEVVNNFKYLGITFTPTGSFTATKLSLADKGLKAAFRLQVNISQFEGIQPSHVMDFFDKLVVPVLTYGCEVWGLSDAPKIEKVHTQFMKRLIGAKRSTTNNIVFGELGRKPIKNHVSIRVIKYWLKILCSRPDRYINQMYRILFQDDENGKTNWVSHIKHTILSAGLGEAWFAQSVGNNDNFLALFQQRQNDIFYQDWNSLLSSQSRGGFYLLYHSFPTYVEYFEKIKVYKHAIALCKFRTFNHRLGVETGRWHKPTPIPYNERLCEICNELDDEYHFLLQCKKYDELRLKYLPKYYRNRPNMYKFIELMSSTTTSLLQKLSAFIFHAFKP
jgi:hypothetical protein